MANISLLPVESISSVIIFYFVNIYIFFSLVIIFIFPIIITKMKALVGFCAEIVSFY